MMLILPWLLGSGVTTAAIGDDEAEVSNDLMVQDVLPDGNSDTAITGDLIQDYVSSETVQIFEDDGETVAEWQEVVIGHAGDDQLAGGAGDDNIEIEYFETDLDVDANHSDFGELDAIEFQAEDFALDLSPVADLWAQIDALTADGTDGLVETVADELDTLFANSFAETIAAPVADVSGVMQSDTFTGVVEADSVAQTVTEAVAPLLSEAIESVAETLAEADMAVEDSFGEVAQAGEAISASAETSVEIDEDANEPLAVTELSETLEILYDTFEANPFAEAQSTAQAAADILSEASTDFGASLEDQVASAIASGDTETLAVIRDFVAGEDAILVEYAGASEPAISVEDDGDGNARIVVDGRQVAVVAAAAAMVTPQDIQAVRVDAELGQRA